MGNAMKALTAKDAKYSFGRLIDLARAEPVTVTKHGRPVVVVMAVEEFERVRALDSRRRHGRSRNRVEGRGGVMADQLQTDRFIKTLKQLGGSAGNGRLREALRWDEPAYLAIKSALIHECVVAPGRGRGGSVTLTDYKSDFDKELDEWFPDEVLSNAGQGAAKQPTSTDRNGVNGRSEGRLCAAGTKSAPSPQSASFQQAFRNIDDALRKEAGCTTELDYTEQTSWLLFLKYLNDLE